MRYRYTLHTHLNKKYIRDDDSVDVDSSISLKARVFDKIDGDLVDELNILNDVVEKQAIEIRKLKEQNRVLEGDALISQSIRSLKRHINQNI